MLPGGRGCHVKTHHVIKPQIHLKFISLDEELLYLWNGAYRGDEPD
jgi:hypothetical protein